MLDLTPAERQEFEAEFEKLSPEEKALLGAASTAADQAITRMVKTLDETNHHQEQRIQLMLALDRARQARRQFHGLALAAHPEPGTGWAHAACGRQGPGRSRPGDRVVARSLITWPQEQGIPFMRSQFELRHAGLGMYSEFIKKRPYNSNFE